MRYFRVHYTDSAFQTEPGEVWNTLAYEAPKAKMVASNLERMGCTVVSLEEVNDQREATV